MEKFCTQIREMTNCQSLQNMCIEIRSFKIPVVFLVEPLYG